MVRIWLGIVFIYAGYDKIFHPKDFAQAVYNYQLLPDSLINITAVVLPWFEIVLGLFMVTGFWLEGCAVAGSALLFVFLSAMGVNMARGLNIHCGCFSVTAESAMDIWTLLRDSILLLISVFLTASVLRRNEGSSKK
ncbi:MAG: MauE/DoxX family redox-associated membrane protein [Thermodesulfobacteriota bacterium]|nr:MauE/DoxX family redox-associated membrane protein [Thermodesulfobacteriota bacterium]